MAQIGVNSLHALVGISEDVVFAALLLYGLDTLGQDRTCTALRLDVLDTLGQDRTFTALRLDVLLHVCALAAFIGQSLQVV